MGLAAPSYILLTPVGQITGAFYEDSLSTGDYINAAAIFLAKAYVAMRIICGSYRGDQGWVFCNDCCGSFVLLRLLGVFRKIQTTIVFTRNGCVQ